MSPEQIKTLLEELLARVEHPLEMMRPMEVSLKDPTPSESRRKVIGIVRRSGFDVDTDVYNWLQNVIPEKAVLKGILWLEEEAEPTDAAQPASTGKKRSQKPPKGQHGTFWQELFLECFVGQERVKALWGLQTPLETNWEDRVKVVFNEPDSLTNISPGAVMSWFVKAGETDLADQVGSISSKIKTKAEKEVFPAGQYFSPFDLGAKRKEPVTEEDTTKDFLRENQLP